MTRYDVVGLAGVGILSAGLWLIWAPLALVGVGALMLLIAMAGPARGGDRSDGEVG